MFRRKSSGARPARRARSNRATSSQRIYRRKPLFELLEDRRMLAVFTVTSNLDTVNAADGVLTLREAVTAANADAASDTINFAASLAGQTIQLSNLGELKITTAMTIDASSLIAPVTVKAFDNSGAAGDGTRSFNINDGTATTVNVELKGLTITGGDLADTGNPAANGAAVYSTEYLSITSCTITGNTSGRRGGGVYAKGPTYLYLDAFTNNTAKYGGAIDAEFADATTTLGIQKSTFTMNTGSKNGGAVNQKNGKLNMYSSTLSGGSTGGNGAGIALDTVAWTIDKTTISGNKADASAGATGGGVSLINSNGEITKSTIGPSGALTGNTSNGNGAGMFISGGTAKITNTTITGNTAAGTASGGGVFASGATVTISGSTISNNNAGFGAGLYFNNVSAPISTTTVSGNIAGSLGGGVFAKSGAIVSFDSSTISGNSAVLNGGGMYTTGSSTGFVNSTVSGNTAKAFGGGIWAQVPAARSLNILYSTITKNTSDFDASGVGSGGGIYLKTGGGDVSLKNSIVAGNNDFTNTAPDIDNTSAGGNPTLTTSFSLIGNNKGSGLAASALIGTPATPINPRLGPLQNNGGPTKTHSLLAGSPAINAGNPAAKAGLAGVPFVDQRGSGFSRVADGQLDIGALEVAQPPTKPTMMLLPSSDTGMFNNDHVTNKMQPAFGGFGPSNSTVLVYAQATDTMGNPSGDPFVIGTGTVGPDASDGFSGNGLGVWEVTVEPLADGKYNFFSRFDTPSDGAGGLSDAVGGPSETINGGPATAIPANGVAASQFSISSSPTTPVIVDLNVTVNITFPTDADLTLTLISPSGTSILLSNHRGGAPTFANFTNTVFDDAAATSIAAGFPNASPPFTGTFRPEEPLSALIGEPLDGQWTLFVTNSGANTGQIVSWSFTIVEPIMVVIDTVAPNTPFLDLTPGSDTGRNSADNITKLDDIFVAMTSSDPNGQFAKLLFTDNLKFRIYDRFVSTNGNGVPEFLIYDSAQDASADMNMTPGDMFTALTQISTFLPAFGTPTSPAIKPDNTLADGTHNLKLVVEDRAGNISHEFLQTITVDTVPPPVSFGLPDTGPLGNATDGLTASSDTGVNVDPTTFADRVTSDTTPTFWGRAEANSIVRLYYDKNADGKIQVDGPNPDIFLGQTTAVPLDGNDAYPNGFWEITSALDLNQIVGLPIDGLRRLLVTAEDVAGNPTPTRIPLSDFREITTVASLQIFIDTQGPQITNLTPNNSNFNLFAPKPAQTGPTPAIGSLTIAVKDLPSRVDQTGTINDFLYAALVSSVASVPGNYVLVGDHVGTIAIQSITITPGPLNQLTGTLTAVTSTLVVTAGGFVGATTQPEVGDYVLFTTGAAVNQVRRITAYNSATGQMTFDIPLLNLPATGDSITVTKAATATIKLTFAAPLPDDRYTLTTKDVLVDPAGNNLDGESHQIEPQSPLFPTGNSVNGGNFGVRFTVDSHPEIGNYVSQNINIDINGNNVWDPANSQIGNDTTNIDLTFTLQVQTAAGATAPGGFNVHDLLFAGKFTKATGEVAAVPRFDQLAAFGNAADLGGVFRWIIDTNGDGVVTIGTDINTIQPTLANFNVAGAIPVGGNFDNNSANGDEIGLYNAGKWFLDTNHNFVIDSGDTLVNSTLLGAPIVGDFDGDGKVDLAVFNNNVFSFDLANNGFGTTDATITWGFPGVLDKPVAADMDQDGITDIGLWVPRTDATNPAGVAQWYFLISNDFTAPGVPAVHTAGSIAKINHQFSPTPLGHDFFAEFGDERSLPIVGNFDPPLSPAALAHISTSLGDFDGSGKVDQADRAVWVANFGSTTNLAADGNGNGVIDTGDYSVWRDHLGQVLAGGGSGAESLVADGADLSGWSTPSQAVQQSVSSPLSASIGADVVAASPIVAPILSTSAASPTSSADQSDRALLLLLSEQQPVGVASLDPSSLVGSASESTADEDAPAAPSSDALAVAWQSWGDL